VQIERATGILRTPTNSEAPYVLSDDVQADINGAFLEGHPIIVVAVTPEGEPTVSFRGTAQALDPARIAFWTRKPAESTTVRSIATNPAVMLIYANMPKRRHYRIRGHAKLVTDDALNLQVWEQSPELERNADPERKGAAIVVEVTGIMGRGADGPIVLPAP
jgi:general stress protein 26